MGGGLKGDFNKLLKLSLFSTFSVMFMYYFYTKQNKTSY